MVRYVKVLSFNEIKPFVRYSRTMYCGIQSYVPNQMRAYDCRLFYCTKGSGTISVDGVLYEISAGCLLMFQPGLVYEYIPDTDNPMHFYVLNFDFTFDFSDKVIPIPPEQIKNFNENNIFEFVFFRDAEPMGSVVYLKNMFALKEALKSINDEFNLKINFFYLRCSALLTDILVQIYKAILSRANTEISGTVIPQVLEYIGDNFTLDISNEDIGKKFGYHPNYLNQLFIHHTGSTLHKYIQNMRITKAIHLLQDTPLPLYEISSLCGFYDYSHFSKCFKGITGVSPKHFRK